MTDLVESSTWTPGIRQFETSDPVEGGPDGIDNVPLRQLANRTRFLKDRQEAHEEAVDPYPQYATKADLAQKVAALVDQSPEALNTLRELANALGNDPSFATTVTNALALKAPLDSPLFTGKPSAPTPPQFDDSATLAPTAFVRSALGNSAGLKNVNSTETLTASAAGKVILLGGTAGFTLTLPPISSVPTGTVIEVQNIQPSGCSIVPSGTDVLQSGIGTFGSYTGIGPGWSGRFVANKVAVSPYVWQVVGGSLALRDPGGPFAASLVSNGYAKLPSGLIIQWGYTAVSSASGSVYAAFPITFPNAVYGVTLGTGATAQGIVTTIENTNITSGFSYGAWSNNARVSGISSFFIAIGK
ncbi:gp53-like domain-containing protein [Burkholderia ubonensis]|uniref:gp53-like domain-containing protein n=1 Tax=Burkholderia ubonensis TaxID=101571 RepID=UPI000F56E372|nr:hypothetical protein [Burkholderia ubonensis]RQP29559.1 hypothetical protein DF155_24355 [Burkholderia ubonensis]RQP35178.1 hypothetical protein DF156_25210 [Burkholderia ubonensis]RQP50081.1 hypothetical protein DF144_23360 [Burkholderia ubonensis]RQP54154.1 hypothetical protein DF151_25110 [Burkholderia ubonensis]